MREGGAIDKTIDPWQLVCVCVCVVTAAGGLN